MASTPSQSDPATRTSLEFSLSTGTSRETAMVVAVSPGDDVVQQDSVTSSEAPSQRRRSKRDERSRCSGRRSTWSRSFKSSRGSKRRRREGRGAGFRPVPMARTDVWDKRVRGSTQVSLMSYLDRLFGLQWRETQWFADGGSTREESGQVRPLAEDMGRPEGGPRDCLRSRRRQHDATCKLSRTERGPEVP